MRVSPGNKKIGKIANVSLTPIKSCAGCEQHCAKDCYAIKAYRMYPAVRNAWDHNYEQATNDLGGFFSEIFTSLKKYKGEYFRWHVAGDLLNPHYFMGVLDVAEHFPNIKFLLFTKQYSIVNEVERQWDLERRDFPSNLQIVFSAWPGRTMYNPHNFPVAWMQDGTEDRVPESAIHCPGSCETCNACWGLGKAGIDVVFNKH